MERRIQQKAEELFFTYGLKSVSMDDIAREAGVSKKTIYQFFTDKSAIVHSIISRLIGQQQAQLERSLRISENAIHEVILIAEALQSLVLKLRPVLLYDLHKYFPECWAKMESFKNETLKLALNKNLEKGIAEGLYRKDINLEIISQFGIVQFSSFISPDNYRNNRFNIHDVIQNVTELFLYGIGSSKGQFVVKKYFDNRNNESKSKNKVDRTSAVTDTCSYRIKGANS